MDEMFVSIGGKRMYLWRGVDHEGEVLDCLVESRRNKNAAIKLIRKLIKLTNPSRQTCRIALLSRGAEMPGFPPVVGGCQIGVAQHAAVDVPLVPILAVAIFDREALVDIVLLRGGLFVVF